MSEYIFIEVFESLSKPYSATIIDDLFSELPNSAHYNVKNILSNDNSHLTSNIDIDWPLPPTLERSCQYDACKRQILLNNLNGWFLNGNLSIVCMSAMC